MAQVRYVSATRVYAKDAPPAVDALDLEIKDGEFMVLVGPSGSGKNWIAPVVIVVIVGLLLWASHNGH